MGFSRPEYWSGEPIPSPGDLPDPGIELRSPALQADSLLTELSGKPFSDKRDLQIKKLGIQQNGDRLMEIFLKP